MTSRTSRRWACSVFVPRSTLPPSAFAGDKAPLALRIVVVGGGLSRPYDPGLPSLGGGDTPLNVAGGVARETTTFYLPPTRPHLRHRRRCRRCRRCCCCCFPMSSCGVNLAGTLGFAGPAPHGFAEANGGVRRGSTPLHREVWLDLCPSPEMGFIT